MKMDRRAFFERAGAASVLAGAMWPTLRARAQARFPKRLLFFLVPEGTIPEQFFPTGSETDFALPRILAPLAAYKDRLVVMKGVNNELFVDHGGPGSILTGVWKTGPAETQNAESSGGLSVDQYLAAKLGGTRVSAYNSVVLPRYRNDSWSRTASGAAVPSEESPYKAFQALLTAGGGAPPSGTPTAAAAQGRRRAAIMGNVKEELSALQRMLGAEEKQKLDMHATALADLERQLGLGGPAATGVVASAGSCKAPAMGSPLETSGQKITDMGNSDPSAWSIYPEIGRLHMEVMAQAFACDQTRFATLLWAGTNNWTKFPFLGLDAWYHTLAHSAFNAQGNENMAKVQEFHIKQLVYFLDKLKSMPEGGGTVLDNTMIVWTSEMGHGNTHSRKNIPFLIIGNAGSALRTNRFLEFTTPIPHNNVLTSICNAMGAPIARYGAAAACTGPVIGLGV